MAGRRAAGGEAAGGETAGSGMVGSGGAAGGGFVAQAARVFRLLALFVLFLGAIHGLGEGFQGLGAGLLDRFFEASRNPFVGLLIGMLATTLVQSSSVTSSLIVGLVAAPESPLPFESAIPMVMGANVGTTVTNTFAALGHLGNRDELRRAFSVATCHDMFNLLAVVVLLPVELATGALARASGLIADLFGGFAGFGFDYVSPLKTFIQLVPAPIEWAAARITASGQAAAAILVVASAALLVAALGLLVRTLKGLASGRAEASVHRILGRSAVAAMAVGAVATVLVQSSSVTTSMLIPLAGAGLLLLDDAFPVTLGANVGTTVTAFLAALAVSGPNSHWGFQLAVVHLLFNLVGIGFIYPVRRIREIPLAAARRLARLAVRNRAAAVAYVLGVFYGLPALFVVISRSLGF